MSSRDLGENDYRFAGLERLEESKLLLDKEFFAGSAYLAGRAAESMLRAVIWCHDQDVRSGRKTLDTGHNLIEMLKKVARLGLLVDPKLERRLIEDVESISRLWFNNMRFVPVRKLKSMWWKLGEIGGKRTLKEAAYDHYDVCSSVVKRCEVLCQK